MGEIIIASPLPTRKKESKKALYLCISKCVQTKHSGRTKIFCFSVILCIHAHMGMYYM